MSVTAQLLNLCLSAGKPENLQHLRKVEPQPLTQVIDLGKKAAATDGFTSQVSTVVAQNPVARPSSSGGQRKQGKPWQEWVAIPGIAFLFLLLMNRGSIAKGAKDATVNGLKGAGNAVVKGAKGIGKKGNKE